MFGTRFQADKLRHQAKGGQARNQCEECRFVFFMEREVDESVFDLLRVGNAPFSERDGLAFGSLGVPGDSFGFARINASSSALSR